MCGSRASTGMPGRVATEISQSSDSPMPIITPARTPKISVPAMAATAIQKSNGFTRASRRISGTSIMPITTASMMRAARTGFGRSENSGASTRSVNSTVMPEVMDASPVRAPEWSLSELADRLVETGMPWNSPAPEFANAWATDSWSMSIR